MYQSGPFINRKDLLRQSCAFLKFQIQRSKARFTNDQIWAKLQFWFLKSIQCTRWQLLSMEMLTQTVLSISENLRVKSEADLVLAAIYTYGTACNPLNVCIKPIQWPYEGCVLKTYFGNSFDFSALFYLVDLQMSSTSSDDLCNETECKHCPKFMYMCSNALSMLTLEN